MALPLPPDKKTLFDKYKGLTADKQKMTLEEYYKYFTEPINIVPDWLTGKVPSEPPAWKAPTTSAMKAIMEKEKAKIVANLNKTNPFNMWGIPDTESGKDSGVPYYAGKHKYDGRLKDEFHVMIDLETLGTGTDAVILSIGAVRFNPMRVDVIDTLPEHLDARYFYKRIDLKDSMRHGKVDASTILWWMEQKEEGRKQLYNVYGQIPLMDALLALRTFLQHAPTVGVWSHGATFDLPILSSACKSTQLGDLFKFRVARDTRTLFAMVQPLTDNEFKGSEPDGLKLYSHHGLADAIKQARWVQEAYYALRTNVAYNNPEKEDLAHATLSPARIIPGDDLTS